MKSLFLVSFIAISTFFGSINFSFKQTQQETYSVILLKPKSRSTVAHVTKVVADVLNIHQREAMLLVASAPVVLKTGLSKDEAFSYKKAIEAVGAEVEVK